MECLILCQLCKVLFDTGYWGGVSEGKYAHYPFTSGTSQTNENWKVNKQRETPIPSPRVDGQGKGKGVRFLTCVAYVMNLNLRRTLTELPKYSQFFTMRPYIICSQFHNDLRCNWSMKQKQNIIVMHNFQYISYTSLQTCRDVPRFVAPGVRSKSGQSWQIFKIPTTYAHLINKQWL